MPYHRDSASLAQAMAEFLRLQHSARARMGQQSRAKLERDGFDALAIAPGDVRGDVSSFLSDYGMISAMHEK